LAGWHRKYSQGIIIMQAKNINDTDIYRKVNERIMDRSFSKFSDYLGTIVTFLEYERKKHNQSIDEINKKIDLGEIELPDDIEQMASALGKDYYDRLQSISEFENILFTSFFVTIYFFLESELTRHCRNLEKQNLEVLSLSDITGSGIQRAITYLVKVQHIEFSLGKSPEWEKIQNYNILRNCIVHNQGLLDESFEKSQREKLLKFSQRPNSKLELSDDTWCVLNKDFCLDALDTIKIFLHSVVFAKAKSR
jgi:hypothetical protein